MDLGLRTYTYLQGDQTWLGSEHGTSNALSVTIVVPSLVAATHYPNGFLPSGLPLAKYTAGPNLGLWTVWVSGGANGAGTLGGFLLDSVPVHNPANNVVGPLLDHGRVVLSRLPIPVDAGGQAAVNGRIWFV